MQEQHLVKRLVWYTTDSKGTMPSNHYGARVYQLFCNLVRILPNPLAEHRGVNNRNPLKSYQAFIVNGSYTGCPGNLCECNRIRRVSCTIPGDIVNRLVNESFGRGADRNRSFLRYANRN